MHRRLLATTALVALLAFASVQVASAKDIVVHADSVLSLSGTDILCTVLSTKGAPSVACFHDPGGPSSSVRVGYAIAVSDQFAAVEPPKSTTPVYEKIQPSFSGIAPFSGGKASNSLITLKLNDTARVSGSHMVVLVTNAKGGGLAIGVLFMTTNQALINGTYTAGLSNHFASVVKVVGVSPVKTTTTYQHAAL